MAAKGYLSKREVLKASVLSVQQDRSKPWGVLCDGV